MGAELISSIKKETKVENLRDYVISYLCLNSVRNQMKNTFIIYFQKYLLIGIYFQ